MATTDHPTELRTPARRRRRSAVVVGVLALGLLALSACGFATTQEVDAAEVTDDSAVLRGTAYDTNGGGVTYWFEYGTSTEYGSTTSVDATEVGGGGAGAAVEATATGLEPATTYHFRLCVEGGDGYGICSTDRTFTTDDEPTPPADCLATFPGPTPYAAGSGATVEVSVDCAPFPGTIQYTCFAFTFGANQLDPGEAIGISVAGQPGFGFVNVLSEPLADRTSCNPSSTVTEALRDGVETFSIVLDPGTSVTIAELEVYTVTAPAG